MYITDAESGGPITGTGTINLSSTYADGSAYDGRFVNTAGDTMTGGLGLPADGLSIGVEQLVCQAGNVGVGTQTPTGRVDVKGGGELAGTGAIGSSGTTVTGASTSFTAQLHVGDVLIAQGQKTVVTAISDDSTLTTDTPFNPALTATAFTYQQPTARFTDNAGNRQFVVNALGNVGIGTATPNYVGQAYPTVSLFTPGQTLLEMVSARSDGDHVSLAGIDGRFNTNSAGHERVAHIAFQSDGTTAGQRGGRIELQTKPDGATDMMPRMTITQAGNVGIGTTPAWDRKLSIRLSAPELAAGLGQLVLSAGDGEDSVFLRTTTESTISSSFGGPMTARDLVLRVHGSGSSGEVMRLTAAGNVGIGTDSPGYLLHVNGSAGKPGGGSWTDSSDIRLKRNVKTLEGSLSKLLRLRGVNFEWKEPSKHGNFMGVQTGMIAQEVEKVFPEWVGTDKDGFKDLTFRGFEALTVEAVREVNAKVEKLSAENEGLKARLAALERAVAMKGVGGTGDVGTVGEERRRGATQAAMESPASAPAPSRATPVNGLPPFSWAWLIALFGLGFVAWGRARRQG